MTLPYSIKDIDKRLAEKYYYQFFQQAWGEVLEPETPLELNWHIEYLCNHLQEKVTRVGRKLPKTKDTIANIPPRTLKSRIFTITLNAWAWVHWPCMKFISASYNADLAGDHSAETKFLVESDWFKSNWGRIEISQDTKAKSKFKNTKSGFRYAVGVGGGVTGLGGDVIIFDDPTDPEQAFSDAFRERANRWLDNTFYNRLNDARYGIRLGVMQRLHENDMTGYILSKYRDEWDHICIPGEYIEGSYEVYPQELKSNYEDGLFFPKRISRKILDGHKKRGSLYYANQIGQAPAPAEGLIYKREWFQRRYTIPPEGFDEVIQSWDFAFKDMKESSFVVGEIWGRKGSLCFLLYQIREKLDFLGSVAAFRRLTQMYPRALKKLVEDKANGPAIINYLKREIMGIIPVPKKDSKEAMAHSVTPMFEAGNVILPKEAWVDEVFVPEFLKFPRSKYDDQHDCTAQALNYFQSKSRDTIHILSKM